MRMRGRRKNKRKDRRTLKEAAGDLGVLVAEVGDEGGHKVGLQLLHLKVI